MGESKGINSKSQLAELERTWQQSQAHDLLAQGVTLADPARIDVRGKLVCGRDVEIDVGCIFEGEVHLGERRASGRLQRHPQCQHRRKAHRSRLTATSIAAK